MKLSQRAGSLPIAIYLSMILFPGAILLLVACQSAADSTQPVDVRQYRTFAVTPIATEGPRSDPAAPIRLAGPAQDAVVQALVAKGYRQAPLERADLLVRIKGEFMPDGLAEGSERRTLVLEALDNRTGKMVWTDSRGKSGSVGSLPPEVLRDTISGMLAPFPSAPFPSAQ